MGTSKSSRGRSKKLYCSVPTGPRFRRDARAPLLPGALSASEPEEKVRHFVARSYESRTDS